MKKILIKREQGKQVCLAEREESRTKFKIKSFLLATLAMAMVAPVFTACSDDDDDKTVNNLVSEYEVNDKMVAAQKAQSKKDVAVLLVAFGSTWNNAFLVNVLIMNGGACAIRTPTPDKAVCTVGGCFGSIESTAV